MRLRTPRRSRRSSTTPLEDRDDGDRVVTLDEAAGVLSERERRCRIDLSAVGTAAQLRHELDDLEHAGRADRVAAREQAAARVDRQRSAERRPAFSDQAIAIALAGEPEMLVGLE